MANRSRLNENGDLVIQKMVFGKWCDVVYNDTENKRRRNDYANDKGLIEKVKQ